MDFESAYRAVLDKLGTGCEMVLATCAQGRPSARTMSVVVYEGKLYFQTNRAYAKAEQLAVNPAAALAAGNVRLEGDCRPIGRPLDPENAFFAERYRERFPGAFWKYSGLPANILYEFTPRAAQVWDYVDGQPWRKFFDVTACSWRQERAECMPECDG